MLLRQQLLNQRKLNFSVAFVENGFASVTSTLICQENADGKQFERNMLYEQLAIQNQNVFLGSVLTECMI